MRVDAGDFTARPGDGVIGASSTAVTDMTATPAFRIDVFFVLLHAYRRGRAGEIFPTGMVIHIPHYIIRHIYETIARIYVPIRSHCKRVPHTIHEGADRTTTGVHTAAHVIDIHDLDLTQVIQVLVQKEN